LIENCLFPKIVGKDHRNWLIAYYDMGRISIGVGGLNIDPNNDGQVA